MLHENFQNSLLISLFVLASCNLPQSTSDNVTTFHAAQKADSEKGFLGYRLEGHASVKRSLPGLANLIFHEAGTYSLDAYGFAAV